jgi:ubiquitin-conjugating enzyme E2 Z
MSSRRLKRISNEIKELNDSSEILEQSGIYIYYNDEDMTKVYSMLVGPEKTPYEKGFYFFEFEYPLNYPMEPPKAKYYTQGLLRHPFHNSTYSVRFNPNLYTCGKVCLSMLNTWNGPGWVPTNTLTNVLVAIQALVLNEEPLRNEPGFENAMKKDLIKYNQIIEYANIRIAVLNMIDNQPNNFKCFKPKMIELFIKNIDYYRNFILVQNDLLKNKVIESPAYGLKVAIDYGSLLYDIEQLYDNYITTIELNNLKSEIDNINTQDEI